ncbi:MAG TPA: acyl-CoA thioesterase II [Yinghuangia sp.]|uniref:acyl-CoA thioesterase n=1 Tax=Yinghuangia sp. YIM S10712 TaxID=3436930 RepID=UPI002CD7AFC6|nr:acyl-CoA thioesterase II [Yinghuangia sp.]
MSEHPEGRTARFNFGQAESFVDLLSLDEIEQNIFRGTCHAGSPLRAFGGQVAAQALVAAGRTVTAERPVHSLHSYFLRPGRTTSPIIYLVDRVRDGRSFTTRRVTAVQHGETIFTLSASFKVPETTTEHQRAMPDVPRPEDLPDPFGGRRGKEREHYGASQTRLVMDMRFVPQDRQPATHLTDGVPHQRVWMKAAEQLPDDPLLHVCAMAYMSDLTLAGTAAAPHVTDPQNLQMASLDHAMWFHRPFRADEWLLFAQASPTAQDARGFAIGEFYDHEGVLVAHAVQEAVIRQH